MSGRHRQPRHLDYFHCPACATRIVIDLDALTSTSIPAIWEIFGGEPKVDWLPLDLLIAAEGLVEKHETAHVEVAS